MRRLIFFILAVCVVIGGGYLFLFKRSDAVRAAKGYKKADSPQVAADMFKRAIEKREYDMAAHYSPRISPSSSAADRMPPAAWARRSITWPIR